MGYAVIMFVIMLLLAVSIALSSNYGISKDSQEAPLLAENAYAERGAGKAQTDFVVEALKVNGTMYYSSVVTNSPQTIHLHLTIKNNGSIVLSPLKYSILLNKTWVWINSTSDNSTPPLTNSTIHSLNLTQKPLNLTLSVENGVKITIPSPPRFTSLSASPNTSDNCWRDLTLAWNKPVVSQWPIDHYALYYTWSDNIDKNDVDVAFTTGASSTAFIGSAFKKVGGNCGSNNATNSLYVWMTAFDTHGNEGVPSGTCYLSGMGGGSIGENCP